MSNPTTAPATTLVCELGRHAKCKGRVYSLAGDHDCQCSCHTELERKAA